MYLYMYPLVFRLLLIVVVGKFWNLLKGCYGYHSKELMSTLRLHIK